MRSGRTPPPWLATTAGYLIPEAAIGPLAPMPAQQGTKRSIRDLGERPEDALHAWLASEARFDKRVPHQP
jgi:hypothetical protein